MKNKKPIKKIGSLLLFLVIFGSVLLFSLPEVNNIGGRILEDEIVDDSDHFLEGLKSSELEFGITEVVSTESTSSSIDPTIAVDGAGNVHVAWEDITNYDGSGEDIDIFYKRWDAVSGTWTPTEVVSTESTSQSSDPTIAVDGAGNVYVMWDELTDYGNSGEDWDIFYKQWDAVSGTWTPTEVVSIESTSASINPIIAVDGAGNVHVMWEDYTNYGESGEDVDIFYKRWDTVSGTWTLPEVVSTESTGYSRRPSIVVDNTGNMHVTWYDYSDYSNSGEDCDIFYKRWDAVSGTWTPTEVVSTESTEVSGPTTIAVDDAGNVHVTWRDYTDYSNSGEDCDIFYKRWDAFSGTWTPTEVVSIESTGYSLEPTIAVDWAGNVHITWHDYTNYDNSESDIDIFYKQWDAISGIWTPTEVVSTESTANSAYTSITVDNVGDLHVVWQDSTNYDNSGAGYDIFYKRLSVPEISTNPFTVIEVTNTPNVMETTPMLGADDVSRIVVYTSQSFDPINGIWEPGVIYAQRLDGDSIIPPLMEVASGSTDNQLNDISGNLVVYTAFTDTNSLQGQIQLIDLNNGHTPYILSDQAMVREARIHGDLVAWIEFFMGTPRVMLKNISSGDAPILISDATTQPASSLQIGDTFVVWEVGYDIVAYDLRNGQHIWIADNSTLHERYPSTSGTWVTWEEQVNGIESRICAVDVDSGDAPIVVIDDGGVNRRPTIDGDIIAYEAWVDDGVNDLNYDIFVYRISTGETLAITTEVGNQMLNNVFGNQVAYVDNSDGTNDIFVTTFWFDPSNSPPEMLWIRQFGTTGEDESWAIATDSTGVYVAGRTEGTLPGQSNTGGLDNFVRKYDHNGDEVWTQQFGTEGVDHILGISIDLTGLYVTGGLGGYSFVRKYDPYDGSERWTQQIGLGIGTFEISVDISGVYVVGSNFSEGTEDVFVRKYDHNGNEDWTRQFGTSPSINDRGRAISVESTGVYIVGFTEGALPSQANAGGVDSFIRKYDIDTGSDIWTRQFGTPETDRPIGVSTDSTGVYIVGYTDGTLPGQTSAGDADAYIRKYDHDGNEVWTHQFGSSQYDRISEVSTYSNDVYVVGQTYGTLPGQTSAGGIDGFVRKYDLYGNEIWTHQFGSAETEDAYGVAVDSTGIYLSGYTSGTLSDQTSAGGRDAFVVKLVSKNTPTGVGIKIITSPEVSLTFSEVTEAGYTQVIVNTENPGSEIPGFQFLGNYYDITTTATYTGAVTVSIAYDDTGMTIEDEETLQLLHWDGTTWGDATTNIDTINNIIYGSVSSFSWFGIGLYSQQLIFGTNFGPDNLDPHYAWEYYSFDVIEQVVETLYANDLSDPELTIIPRLASDYGSWSVDGLNYTVPLRTDVTFHDGAQFNAQTVKWNFDRLAYFMNIDGSLPPGTSTTQISTLYLWPDGTPIIDRVEIVDDYTVKFVLTKPFTPLEALLSFSGSGIMSPAATPPQNYIDTATGDLVGTGPFVYDNYEVGVEVTMSAYENYWAGAPNIDKLTFSIIPDTYWRNQALLDGNVDFIKTPDISRLQEFRDDPDITLVDAGQDAIIYYLGMNNRIINVSFREAISYAINYTYIIDELLGGEAVRLKSPIPLGIGNANWSFNVPILNLTRARQIMQSMGFGVEFNVSIDAEWEATSFISFNYTYNIGNTFRENMLVLLQDNLGKIGITVTDAGMTWEEFLNRYYETGGRTRDQLELYFLGWGPDYSDPSNFINPLFTNRSVAANGAQYNGFLAAIEDGRDPYALNDNVQLLMEAAIAETDPVQREKYYDRIQELLIERDFPWAWGYVRRNYDVYSNKFIGFQSNPMDKVWFYPVWPKVPTILLPFVIDDDISNYAGDYTWAEAVMEPWCTGSGTELDPYVIENLNIDGCGETSITIRDSNVYFVIRYCTIYNSSIGILLSNVDNGKLIDNDCSDNDYGIYLEDFCSNNNITGNIANDNSVGIFLYHCDDNIITENTAAINDNGIYVKYSDSNTVSKNNVYNNSDGIYLSYSDYNTVSDTIAHNNDNGIYLSNSDSNTISENIFYNNTDGIFLDGFCSYNEINGNTAYNNSNHGIYLTRYCNENTIIGNAVNENDIGIYIYRYCDENTITGNTVNNNTNFGIQLYYDCDENTITANTVDENSFGVYLNYNCNYNNITGNTVNNSQNYGIFLLNQCNYNNITGNTANNNRFGIYINYYCDFNNITGNFANSNEKYGICIYEYCNNNTITGNTANNNEFYGIYLKSNCNDNTITENTASNNYYGISFELSCYNNTISGNTANNNGYGIHLNSYCDNNTITGNNASNNNWYGIYLENYCNDNTITGNTASNNYYGISFELSCYNNTISGNTANNNGYGIHLNSYCDNNTITGNTANSNELNGIYLATNCNNNTITGNTVNDNDYGIYLLDYCNGNDIIGNNASSSFGTFSQKIGVYLENGCDFNTISGNTANYNNWTGIRLEGSNNNTVSGNTANYNNYYGIYLKENCDYNTITGNAANDNNHYGIYLLSDCDNNTITGNTASNFGMSDQDGGTYWNQDSGIYLKNYCDFNTISGNIVNENLIYGIYLNSDCNYNHITGNIASNIRISHQDNGIYLENHCDFNNISGNTVTNNNDNGIYLEYCNNTTVFDNIAFSNKIGIHLNYSDFNTVFNNTVYQNGKGIYLYYSNSNTVFNNTVYQNAYGILLGFGSCNNNTIAGNTVNNNTRDGIHISYHCDFNTISGNTANNNYDIGIFLDHNINNNISGNTANYNFCGILLSSCNNITVSGNIMNECGLLISGFFEELSSHNIDTSNLVNGKLLYYYTNEVNLGPTNFTNVGQVILVNCNNSMISNLNVSQATQGVSLYYCNNNIISGITANNNSNIGICLFRSCNNNTITGNTANNNGYSGIFLANYCNNNTITGNTANNNNEYGIVLAIYCNDNDIIGNTVNENYYGIYLDNYACNNIITANILNGNIERCIFETYEQWLHEPYMNLIFMNLCNGVYDGVYIDDDGQVVIPWFYRSPSITWAQAVTYDWCSGSGTLSDPYVLEDFVISNPPKDPYRWEGVGGFPHTFVPYSSGILITDSTAYFVISNCTIFNSSTGITLSNVDNGNLIGNNCSNNLGYGIRLYNSDNNTVSGNTANNNELYGIYLHGCDYNNIMGNTASNIGTSNQDSGIYLENNCDFNTISENTVNNNNNYGIYLFDECSDNTITGNTANENYYGIYLDDYSSTNTITGNILNGNIERFIFETGDYFNLIFMNLCNGAYDGVHIDDDGGDLHGITWAEAAIYDWCSGSGTLNDPYVLEDLLISNMSNPYGNGISVRDSTAYFVINNCTIFNSYAGIALSNVDNGKLIANNCSNKNNVGILLFPHCNYNNITGNTVSNNNYCGICLVSSCNDNTITGNTANNNTYYGIYLDNECNDNNITDNTAHDNDFGIYLSYSHDNLIFNNDLLNYIENIHEEGCWNVFQENLIQGAQIGINLDNSTGNEIDSNTFINNGIGIMIRNSADNSVLYNIFESNDDYAIMVTENSNNNEIYYNEFIDNNEGGVQAYDDSGGNSWTDDQGIGNYWNDFSERYPDSERDDILWIGDYELDGQIGVTDGGSQVFSPGGIDNFLTTIIDLIDFIQNLPDECWENAENKHAMIDKLLEIKVDISLGHLEEAYDKLLHDVKPKLTALKIDEIGDEWGNGVLNKPWIVLEEFIKVFILSCNDLLWQIQILITDI